MESVDPHAFPWISMVPVDSEGFPGVCKDVGGIINFLSAGRPAMHLRADVCVVGKDM